MEIQIKTEVDKVSVEDVIKEVEYLIIYDMEGNQLVKGDNKDIASNHELEYDGLIYLANTEGRISIDYKSLIDKFKDE